ncbi:TetR/AcrR family transcriptional regulator [Actinomycetospora sp. OC33-EN08]|uniref:TetR/AcrR family transcriptional regulator n=1 Tax=Actinomycetospora aurantiaca TaxID=3129233 RepID=A0ABU8MP28_9PSEU
MPRTPAPGTRDRILGVASRLFYAHGVRAVGMSRIISEAGTGKNLLYQHFPTKADLVAAYLDQAAGRRADAAQRALDAAGEDPADRIVALVAEVGRVVDRPGFRGCAFRNYLAEFPDGAEGEDAAPTAVAREYLARSRRRIEDLVGELDRADPERLTERLWLLVDGLYVQATYREAADRHLGVAAAVGLARELVAGSAMVRS